MSKHHRLKTRTEGSAPNARAARQREAMAKQQHRGLAPAFPISFLLNSSSDMLADFELARLAEVNDLRAELHVILDRLIDTTSQAALAAWFRSIDRHDLKVALENPPDIDTIIQQAQEQIRDRQRSKEEAEDYGEMPMPNIFRPSLPPGAAHLAASLRYQERNRAESECSICPDPLDRNSVRFCTKHLAMQREKDRPRNHTRGKRGNPNLEPGTREYLYGTEEVPLSTHGRQPGTLASLEMNREKKTRALLAELGIKPEYAAVSLKAAKEALQARHEAGSAIPGGWRCHAHNGPKSVGCAAR